jgi:hypothetical protein
VVRGNPALCGLCQTVAMPLNILLVAVSQPGSSPRRRSVRTVATVSDVDGSFVTICAASKLPMLTKIDPWGDLVLTSVEMGQFIDELRAASSGGDAGALVDQILELAARCAVDRTNELHFIGG